MNNERFLQETRKKIKRATGVGGRLRRGAAAGKGSGPFFLRRLARPVPQLSLRQPLQPRRVERSSSRRRLTSGLHEAVVRRHRQQTVVYLLTRHQRLLVASRRVLRMPIVNPCLRRLHHVPRQFARQLPQQQSSKCPKPVCPINGLI